MNAAPVHYYIDDRGEHMQYRKMKDGSDVSILGYGCMRFTSRAGVIDINKAEQEVMAAVRMGVNYFDTAYIYPGSEEALGKIFERNACRDKVKIATKLPYYLIKSSAAIDKYYNEQCRRLRTDHIDFYLMHMLSDVKAWERMKELGIVEWAEAKKKSGEIHNFGFSFHGDTDTFIELIDAYDWDFCQIQYNYLDEHTQAGRRGLEYAASKGIPVVIMEPLRGGKLVTNLPKKAKLAIERYPVERSAAQWAFRWLWDQPEVTCVLSGMNSMQMLRENVKGASEAKAGELTARDHRLIEFLKIQINKSAKVGCTGCRYCMPCPQGVDIPATFSCYNRTSLEKIGSVRTEYLQITSFNKKQRSDMTRCIGCGKCERHCPQHINIREELKNAESVLMPFYMKATASVINKFTM